MKTTITFLSCLVCIQLFACCSKSTEMRTNTNDVLNTDKLNTDSMKLRITIGTATFIATLYNNQTVEAFKTRLPMTVNMSDLHANEKYFDLPESLPANASNPGTISTGDLMLYGSNTLVLFYKSFATSYNYTAIGRIDDVTGLNTALGSGGVNVAFELQK